MSDVRNIFSSCFFNSNNKNFEMNITWRIIYSFIFLVVLVLEFLFAMHFHLHTMQYISILFFINSDSTTRWKIKNTLFRKLLLFSTLKYLAFLALNVENTVKIHLYKWLFIYFNVILRSYTIYLLLDKRDQLPITWSRF